MQTMNQKDRVHLPYLLFLSLVAGMGGFLFGYDTAVVSGTNAQVASLFGLDEMLLGWYVGCALVGSIGGVAVAGLLSDRYGRKRTMQLAALIFFLSAIGCAASGDFQTLILSRICVGVGIGVISIVSPLYISEIAVDRYRGSLVSLYQLGVTVGIVGAYLVNHLLLGLTERYGVESWRAMLGACALPALFFFVVLLCIPESPRWLLLGQRVADADRVLRRIWTQADEAESQRQAIVQHLADTRRMEQGKWEYLLRPSVLKLVAMGSAIAILGQFMGVNAVLYYGPSIFEQSGLSGGDSLFYQVLVGLVNMLTTVLALFIIDRVGRKQLVYWGVSGMIVGLLSIAYYFHYGQAQGVSSLFLLAGFLFYVFCCAISICAVVFVLLSELFPLRVRGLAMSIAGFALWIGTYLIGQLTPWMLKHLTPEGTFLLFAAMCLPYLWIMWRWIPETTGRSLEEIEKENLE